MSKTYRRKNFEITGSNHPDLKSRASPGSKTAGYYTERDVVQTDSGHGRGWMYIYRAPTTREYWQHYWRIHGESSTHNAWGPGPEYKQLYARKFKTREKRELRKALANLVDYDAVFYANPSACGRMWAWY